MGMVKSTMRSTVDVVDNIAKSVIDRKQLGDPTTVMPYDEVSLVIEKVKSVH